MGHRGREPTGPHLVDIALWVCWVQQARGIVGLSPQRGTKDRVGVPNKKMTRLGDEDGKLISYRTRHATISLARSNFASLLDLSSSTWFKLEAQHRRLVLALQDSPSA